MTARMYCSFGAVLLCLFGNLNITDATLGIGGLRLKDLLSHRGCSSDRPCSGRQYCSERPGCSRFQCDPVSSQPGSMKPGQCPDPKNIPLSAKNCVHDGQCPATQKCLPNHQWPWMQ
ncbi:perlwapin-like [Carassius auratus]|uniref:Perlwapin-like n=1 Tax=Carassius auratus TaxID=7957 RepID=A0A6P6KPI9_CARAU|nr:perlwapin-like [Carassius auratus]